MGSSTERRQRQIDSRLTNTGGGGFSGGESGPPGGSSGIPAPGAPLELRLLGTYLIFSAVTAQAGAEFAWFPPPGITPDDYILQWATDAAFTNPVSWTADRTQNGRFGIDGLPVASTIYVRIAARARKVQGAYSATLSFVTPADTTPPNPPTSPAATFLADGSLQVSWVKPTSANFKSVELRIWNSAAKTVQYDLIPEADGTVYTWPAARNRQQTVGSPDGSPDRSVYVELRAKSWGNVYSTTVNASATLAPPANVTGATAIWDGATGSCRFKWNPVAGAVRYDFTIDGTTRPVADTEYEYTLAVNRQEHSGTADPALSWSIVAVDALDQVSVTPASGTATLARPATPSSVVHPWSGDTGTAGGDWSIDCAVISGVVKRQLTIDGITRDLPVVGRYSYPFLLNAQEHSGTADPVLTWSLVWVDALGQTSTTPASGTATNAAPPAPSAVSLEATFSGFLALVTTTVPADFKSYRYRIIQTSPVASDLTFDDPAAFYARNVTTPATYQVGVRVVDLFNQTSTETLSATLLADALTLAQHRERIIYSDSESTAAAALKTAMSDNTLTSGGISYASNAGWVRWIRADWQLLERLGKFTLSLTPTSGTTSWYIRTSKDGSTWSYFSGPVVATGATGQNTTLTARADAATAQSNAVSSATLGSGSNTRVDMPTLTEVRYVELWLRNTAASTRVDEFYPRRSTQTDDLDAEAVRAFNISAGAVTTDKLTIPGTASIDAQLRLIAFRVPVSLDVNSGIYQGTGTFASPTTGLKIWNDSGIGRLATYSGGVIQVSLDSVGALTWAAGNGKADATGIAITPGASLSSYAAERGYRFSGATSYNGLYSREVGSDSDCFVVLQSTTARTLLGGIEVRTITGGIARIGLEAAIGAGVGTRLILERLTSGGTGTISMFGAHVRIPEGGINVGDTATPVGANIRTTGTMTAEGGLNLGTASGAGTGQVWASASFGGDYLVLLGNDPPAGLRGVSMRYRSDIDRAVLTSVHQGTSLKPLQLVASALSFADGVTPVARQTAAAAAADLASVITLANSLRTILVNLGLAQ